VEKVVQDKENMVNKEQLDEELVQKLVFSEKLGMIKSIATEIIIKPTTKFRKLKDLLLLCSDKNVDVVLKSILTLCDVFCEILPDYRIREFDPSAETKSKNDKPKDKKNT
jgi:hypothetical protein